MKRKSPEIVRKWDYYTSDTERLTKILALDPWFQVLFCTVQWAKNKPRMFLASWLFVELAEKSTRTGVESMKRKHPSATKRWNEYTQDEAKLKKIFALDDWFEVLYNVVTGSDDPLMQHIASWLFVELVENHKQEGVQL